MCDFSLISLPLVVGAFGESSTGLLKLVKMWARHAASGDVGAAISPLANTDRRGEHSPSYTSNSYGQLGS